MRKTSSPWGILDLFLSVWGRANLFCTQVGIQKLVMRKVLKVYHIHSWKAFWSFSSNFLVTNPAKKEQPRLPITMFVIWAVCGFWLLLNIHLQSSRTYRKKNRVVRFKSFTSPLTFMFCFFLYPLFFLSFFFFFRIFLPCFYFFSVEKVLRTTNAFRIIGLERLKLCRWAVEIDFQGSLYFYAHSTFVWKIFSSCTCQSCL